MTDLPTIDSSTEILPASAPATKVGRYRWRICALLFIATTINYMDRQLIGVLKPVLQKDLHWNETDYGNIIFYFQLAYACGYLFAGRLMDWVGVRVGYAISVGGWSLASMANGLARTVAGFSAARFGLGLAEGGNFPAAIKTVSAWFPRRERALATGIFNSGCNIGAFLTPLIVPPIIARWGWPAAFYWTGALGLLWVIAWSLIYREPADHPRLSPAELAYIRSDGETDPPNTQSRPMGWLALLRFKTTWAYVIATMITSPVWWFYLFWVPDFLNKKYGLDVLHLGLPLATIYLMSDLGSIAGGWCSSTLIRRGWSVNVSRKIAMLICAIAVVPVFFASVTTHLWLAVFLIGLAAAAHQGWSANLFTFASDTTPQRSVSSVVGLGGLISSFVAMGTSVAVGYVLQLTGSYYVLFATASSMYLLALLIVQVLVPRIAMPAASGETA